MLIAVLPAAVLLLTACGSGSSGTAGGSGTSGGATASAEVGGTEAAGKSKTPEQVWAKEVEGVMRRFENSSAKSVTMLHTNVSQYNLEPTYTSYSTELAQLGKELEATKPPPNCEHLREQMGVLSRKVSAILGVLAHQPQLSPEEYSALVFQQRYKFARVGQKLTTITIEPHC
jgi:hypothetical protein